jgi:hypothetical protein
MTTYFQMPRWSARNPLGIIALFISLIYGMSALLLGMSVQSLSPNNQTILVFFIVVFPFVVLTVFGWLVAKHHKKLYGPSDYRSDEGFLNAASGTPPSTLGKKLSNETLEEEEEEEDDSGGNRQEHEIQQKKSTIADSSPVTRLRTISEPENVQARPVSPVVKHSVLARAYLAEGLVFQELQTELGGAVRREVTFGMVGGSSMSVDGAIETPDHSILAVDVFLARHPNAILNRLRMSTNDMLTYIRASREKGSKSLKGMLAIVAGQRVNNSPKAMESIQKFRLEVGDNIQIRIFNYSDLLRKYGFPIDEESDGDLSSIGLN